MEPQAHGPLTFGLILQLASGVIQESYLSHASIIRAFLWFFRMLTALQKLVPIRRIRDDRSIGVVDLKSTRTCVEATGFNGFCQVEIVSKYWCSKPPEEVLDTCIKRFKTYA